MHLHRLISPEMKRSPPRERRERLRGNRESHKMNLEVREPRAAFSGTDALLAALQNASGHRRHASTASEGPATPGAAGGDP